MTTKARLNYELEIMREIYPTAKELNDVEVVERILIRAQEIEEQLKSLCYQCGDEPRSVNEFYCSEECNDLYYRPIKKTEKHSIEYMQEELLKMGRRPRRK